MRKIYISALFIITLVGNIVSQDMVISHVSNHYQNHFGWSISGDNEYIVVSDPRDSISFYGNGSVNIYKRSESDWEYYQTLQNKNLKPYDYFGHRTFMKGNYLAVSAIGDPTKGFMSGAVHIFYLDNGAWTFIQTIQQDSIQEKVLFGESLCISGQYLFVGAPGCNNHGAVFVYALSGNTFSFLQKIENPYPLGMQFGKSIAVSDDLLFVGAPSVNRATCKGSVFIYKRNNAEWELNNVQSELTPDDEDYGALFGFSVSAEKDKLLIGAPHANVTYVSNEKYFFAGKAYYYKNISGTYIKQVEFNNPEPASHDLFGSGVMISDSILYMTAPKDDVDLIDEGSVFLFENINDQWVQKSLNSPEQTKNQYFSNSFFVFDHQLFIGSGGDKAEDNKGKVFTFDVRELLNIPEASGIEVSLFPNPADENLRINISDNYKYTIRICAADGKEYLVKNLKGNQDINISELPIGHYIVSVNTKHQTYTEKLIVLHR